MTGARLIGNPLAFAGLFAALLAGIVALALREDYDDAIALAMTRTAGLAQALQEHTSRILAAANLVMDDVAELVADDPVAAARGDARLRAVVARHLPFVAGATYLALVDADGEVVFNSALDAVPPVNISDRDHFRHHRDHPGASLYLAQPVVLRSMGTTVTALSRRIDAADGGFAGEIVIGIDARYFESFYAGLGLGADGSITLYRNDGYAILRAPFDERLLGRSLAEHELFAARLPQAPAGSFVAPGVIRPGVRIFSYQAVPDSALVMVAAMLRDDALAQWWARLYWRLGEAALLLLVFLLGGAQLRRALSVARGARRRLESIFITASAGIIVRGADGVIVAANPAAATILGRDQRAIVGQGRGPLPWRPVDVHGAAIDAAGNPVLRIARAGGVLSDVVMGIHRPDGALRWIAVNAAASPPGLRDPTFAVSSFIDITERFAAEAELRRSRARLASIFEATAEAITVHDTTGRIVAANPAAEALLARPRDVLLAAGGPLPWGPLDGGGSAADGTSADPVAHALATGRTVRNAVLRLDPPGGRARWISVNTGVSHDTAGRVELVVCSMADITARTQLEDARAAERVILELIAAAGPLDDVLAAICRAFERDHPSQACSIMLVAGDGRHLRAAAAPSLPEAFCRAVDGLEIGPAAGSCGTAAWRGARVVVADVLADPLWAPFRDLALAHGLRACWSTPFAASGGRVLGAFAVYARVPSQPAAEELAVIDRLCGLAAIAVEGQAAQDALRRSEGQLRAVMDNTVDGLITIDERGTILSVNRPVQRIFGYAPDEMVGRNVAMLMPSPDRESHDGYLEAYLRGGAAKVIGKGRTVRGLRKDGTAFAMDLGVGEVALAAGRRQFVGTVRDVTARETTERAVRDSEERYRALVEFLPLALVMQDEEYRIKAANQAACRLFEAFPAELLGRPYLDLVHPDDRAAVLAARERATVHGEAQAPVERRYVTMKGRTFVGEASGAFVTTPVGREVIGAIRDVTERLAAERAVRDSEARYRTVVDFLPIALLTLQDGRIVQSNPAAREMFDASADEPLEGTESLRLVDQRDHARVRELRDGGSTTPRVELTYVTRSGRSFVGEAAAARFGDTFEDGMLVAIVDVTERHRAERALRETALQLRTVIDSLPHAVGYVDADQRVRLVNRVASEWYRFNPSDRGDRALATIMSQDWYDANRAAIGRTLAGEATRIEGERAFPDGVTRAIEAVLVPDRHGDAVRGFFFVVTDVTERLRTEEQLRQAQKMEAVGQLTGGVAHDFNNLLAVIMGNLELMALDLGGRADLAAFVDKALRATTRGADLTRRLLAFSRRQDLRPEHVDLNALVRSVVELLGRTIGENIAIETRLAEAGGGVFDAVVDRGQLENALLNLAVNARDAMPDGGRLTIATQRTTLDADYAAAHAGVTAGEYALIEVTDTGVGMSAEIAARVFEPFFTTKDVGKGSGLGLSMVYGFVKQSGGHVALYSEPGLGTTVKLFLPLPRAAAAVAEAADPDGPQLRGRGQRVLVVEDDPDVRQLVVAQLAALDYAVHAAGDGPEALTYLDGGAPVDVLMTDVVMPGGLGGVDLAAAARVLRPGLRVLYVSGYAEGGNSRGRIQAEHGVFLAKPFTRARLAEALARVLDEPEKRP